MPLLLFTTRKTAIIYFLAGVAAYSGLHCRRKLWTLTPDVAFRICSLSVSRNELAGFGRHYDKIRELLNEILLTTNIQSFDF